jgi:hypothetical protein
MRRAARALARAASSRCGGASASASAGTPLSAACVAARGAGARRFSNLPVDTVYGGPTAPNPKRVTLRTLDAKYRRGEPISMVTAYDYPSAVHVRAARVCVPVAARQRAQERGWGRWRRGMRRAAAVCRSPALARAELHRTRTTALRAAAAALPLPSCTRKSTHARP